MNAQLAGQYARLWRQMDGLIVLEAPDFSVVSRWRDEQERALPARADLRIVLGDDRAVRRMVT